MMSLKSTFKLLFLCMCINAVVARLRTPNDKNQQRSLLVASPFLDVTIADISIKYNNAKGYDANGCLDLTKAPKSKYYAQVQYELRNSGDAGFIAPIEFVNYAACGTPAIHNFLTLKIEGGIDGSRNPYPAIELSRFATCVIDDSNTTDAGSCVTGGPTTDFTKKPMKSYGISQGGSYGVTKIVSVKFPLTAEQFNALSNSLPSTLTFTLSVNKDISPNGAAGVVTAVDGSKLKVVTTWEATGQGTSILLFIRPPSASPTTAPTTEPSASPTVPPSTAPSTVPSTLPTTTPSNIPSTLPTIEPSTIPSATPTTKPTAAPSAVPSVALSASPTTAVITAPSGASILCDQIIGPDAGTTTIGYQRYFENKSLRRVCFTTNVQSISDRAFIRSSAISIYFPSSVKVIAGFFSSPIKNVTITGDIDSFGGFNDIPTLKTLAFPGAVGTILGGAFYGSGLVFLSFGGIVGRIENNAFIWNRIQTVTLPAGLSFLGVNSFRGNALTSVTFLGPVTTIEDNAFDGNQLKTVTFRGAVTTIGNDVFIGNPAFTVYYPRSWTTIPTAKFPGATFVATDY